MLHAIKPPSNGTSLGLCVVHGSMRQSGGQVRVYSDVGRGTTMCSAGHGIPQPLLYGIFRGKQLEPGRGQH